MATAIEQPDAYVDARAAAKVLGSDITRHQVRQLAARGLIGTRAIPGVRNRFRLADLEQLARESIRPATQHLNPAPHGVD